MLVGYTEKGQEIKVEDGKLVFGSLKVEPSKLSIQTKLIESLEEFNPTKLKNLNMLAEVYQVGYVSTKRGVLFVRENRAVGMFIFVKFTGSKFEEVVFQ